MAKRNTYRLLGILLMLLCLHGKGVGQTNKFLTNGDTAEVQLCRAANYITLCPSYLPQNNEPFDAWAIVYSVNTLTIQTLISSEYSHVTVGNATGILIDSATSLSNTVLQGCAAPVTVHIHIDNNANANSNVGVKIVLENDDCQSSIWGIVASDLGGNDIDVSFHTADSLAYVSLDDGPWIPVPSGPWYSSIVLHEVECNQYHTLKLTTVADSNNQCCTYSHTFRPTRCPPAEGCFEAADLNEEYVSCSYGSLSLNYVQNGIVPGRHTVMRNPTVYDPVVGGALLRTVCEGCDSTVRLGNSQIGAQWEAIDYLMKVDTMLNAILILKYAAVLENPGHGPQLQPRFTFDMNPVGDACAHANFIASDSMGWAYTNGVMWKDWTTVGFDLSELHGQTVTLHFETRDCVPGAHFGYAYFTTQCATRQIIAQECGIVDTNTFTAPEGFNYQWTDPQGNTISTSRTITVPSDGRVYQCHLTAIEDSTCGFTLGTYAGVRLPKAAGSVEQVHTNDCRNYDVSFKSESFVTSDGINPVPYGYRCDEETWYFGDGTSATGFNPTHTYPDTGFYNIMIIASPCGGQCVDTGYLTIHLTPIQIAEEVRIGACDSLRWRDGVLYTADTLGPTLLITGPTHCDSLLTLNLRIKHSSHGNQRFDTICRHYHYPWHDTLFVMPPDSTHMTLYDTLTTRTGCDSSIILQLTTRPDIVTDPEQDTLCFGQWRLWQNNPINDTSQPNQLLCISLRDTLRTALGCDSVIGLNLCRWPRVDYFIHATAHCEDHLYILTINYTADSLLLFMQNDTDTVQLGQGDTLSITVDSATAYLFTAGYTDSLFCLTDTTLILQPISIPEAALKLTPEKLTYENLTLHAYDITGGEHSRSWSIVHADGDSVRLPDHEAHLVYTADVGDDSTRVVLTVDNDVCLDTATGCIYLVRADFFAPNVFTPDLPDNNRFVIPGIGIRQLSLSIFNRMGLLVYSTDHPEEGWDGTHEGVPCMQGAYVWHLTYTLDITPERIQTAVGTVTLVR